MPDYVEISKIIKLFPWLYPTYKVHVKVLTSILVLYDMFDLFLPLVDRYFFIPRSFSLDFYTKNGSVFGC